MRVVSGFLRNIVVPVLVAITFIDWFVRGIFPSERKIVASISDLVPTLGIEDILEERRNNEKT